VLVGLPELFLRVSADSLSELEQAYNSRIASASLNPTDILLREAYSTRLEGSAWRYSALPPGWCPSGLMGSCRTLR
jgi:hypothetical protein